MNISSLKNIHQKIEITKIADWLNETILWQILLNSTLQKSAGQRGTQCKQQFTCPFLLLILDFIWTLSISCFILWSSSFKFHGFHFTVGQYVIFVWLAFFLFFLPFCSTSPFFTSCLLFPIVLISNSILPHVKQTYEHLKLFYQAFFLVCIWQYLYWVGTWNRESCYFPWLLAMKQSFRKTNHTGKNGEGGREERSASLMIPGSYSCSTCASSIWAVEKDPGYSVEQSIFCFWY